MTFEQYWAMLVKHWRLIIICFIVVGLGAYIASRLMTPIYQSTAVVQVAIRSGNNQADYNNLLASDQLVQTEAQLALSNSVLREVSLQYPGLTVEQLTGAVTSTPELNTQLFEIIVQDRSPRRAASLANDIAATLIRQQFQVIQQDNSQSQQQIQQDLNTTLQQIDTMTTQIAALKSQGGSQSQIAVLEVQLNGLQQHYSQWQTVLAQLELTQAQNGNFLRIAQSAEPSLDPVRPNMLLNTGAGLLVGLFLGMLLAVLFEQLDTRIHSSEALTQLLDWPVLATIWLARSSKKENVFNPTGHDGNVEGYRILRTNIGFSGIDKPLHSLMVTSAVPRDGKSITAANLAIFMARAGKTTLLIDADLRRPALHNLFGFSSDKMGLSNAVLAFSMPKIPETPPPAFSMSNMPGTSSVQFSKPDAHSGHRLHPSTLHPADALTAPNLSLEPFVHSVGIPNLWVMPSGPLPPNPPELLDSKAMQRLLTVIADYRVELVIFDTPPILGLSDVSILASKMDGILVVVDITHANKKHLKQMKAVLMQAGAHVLGCVVNKQRRGRHDMTYPYYYYQADEQNGGKNHNKGKKDASAVPIKVFSQREMQNGARDHSPQAVNFPGTTIDVADAPTEKLVIISPQDANFPGRRSSRASFAVAKVDGMKIENRQQVQEKKRKLKKICLIALPILLLSVLAGSGISLTMYYGKYSNYASLAQTGIQHLQTAATLLETLPKNPLDAPVVSQTQHEFASAMITFVRLDDGLKSLPGISTFIPVYGARLSAALHLAPLAIDLSQAGIAVCIILNLLLTRIHDPLNTQGQGLTMLDLGTVSRDFQQMKLELNLAVDQAHQIQPTDLQFDPRLEKMFASFRKEIPTLQIWIHDAQQFLTVAPTLLGVGSPTNYLLEILDSTELRPAGGFIGNYGIATFSGGRLTIAHITDADLLDKPYRLSGHSIPYPSAYSWFNRYLADGSWSFRDSNLDADFPTAARYGEQNYMREGGTVPVQGVIAITPAFIQQVLTITGPIDVPEYHENVTAQNLIDRIHYYQLGPGHGSDLVPSPDGHSSPRKRFTELLAEHLLARVRQLPSSSFSQLLQLMMSSIHTKDVQIYLNPEIAEHLLQSYGLDGSIQSPPGDHLFLVDTNVAANKANSFIVNSLHDQVTVDEHGNAVHRTTITYAWTLAGQNYGSKLYRDYVRLYVPPGSTLSQQNGWQPLGTSTAFGSQVWAGFFTLVYGQTRTITLVWTSYGVARNDANGWHYQYLLQRQAGAQRTLNLQVMLPACAVVTNRWGSLASKDKQEETLTQALTQDLNVGVDYACK